MSEPKTSIYVVNLIDQIEFKPRARMSRVEKSAFDAWLRWLNGSMDKAEELGIPAASALVDALASAKGKVGKSCFFSRGDKIGLDADILDLSIDMGVRLAESQGLRIRREAPQLPCVWPDDIDRASTTYDLHCDALLRYGIAG